MSKKNKNINENEVMEKEINQLDKVDESVEKVMNNMGALYKKVLDKLTKDKIDFLTKEPLKEPFEIIIVPENKIQKGMIAFVAVNQEAKK